MNYLFKLAENNYYYQLWKLIKSERKKQSYRVVFLMVISSISEVVSIGALLPFLGVISSPELVLEHELMKPLISYLEISNADQILLPVSIIFVSAIIIANSLRLLVSYLNYKLSYAVGADFSVDIYRLTLYQDYLSHLNRNSSEVINGVINKTTLVTRGVITPLLYLFSSVIMLIGILATLLLIDPLITLISILIIGFIYAIILFFTKNILKNNSEIISNKSNLMFKTLQEGMGAIRDVIIDNRQNFYCDVFKGADLPVRRASVINSFISVAPRYVVEAIGVTLIAVLAYFLTTQSESRELTIPVLGVMAMGAQRLLPIMQQIYASISTLRGTRKPLLDVMNFLNQTVNDDVLKPKSCRMKFNSFIELRSLSFQYTTDSPTILKNINLKLPKGSKVGIIGKTGSGKSTLADIIMGLIQPTSGSVLIDGKLLSKENIRDWHSIIAHVPQNIFLSDSSIIENVALGIPKDEIDFDRAIRAIKEASLSDFVSSLPEKHLTLVGEMGAHLSGGQRQRIGIARALYKRSKLIVFDEATSALDNETEKLITNTINQLSDRLTVLVISHKISTLESCNLILKLNDDSSISIIDYESLINN